MNLPVIDDFAWLAFRFVGLTQVVLWQVIAMFYKPKSLGEKIDFMGRIYAGYYIFGAADRNRVPRIVREKGLMVGRIYVAAIAFVIIQSFLQKLVK